MRKTLIICLILFSVAEFAPVFAMTVEEVAALRNSVIEMCRGGTTQGSSIRHEVMVNGQAITVSGVVEGSADVTVLLSTDQWNGIRALMVDPSKYVDCVEHTVNVLAPEITTERNIDLDLHARLEYIRSPVFCNSLIHVVSQAPEEFAEWRRGAGSRTQYGTSWEIGPYIMGDPSALGMRATSGAPLSSASVNHSTRTSAYYFYEPLLVTSVFQAAHRTGLITSQIVDAIDSCFTYGRFRKVKKVRLVSGEPRRLSGGTYAWDFDKTGFLGATAASFAVFVGARENSDGGIQWIDLRVHAPD